MKFQHWTDLREILQKVELRLKSGMTIVTKQGG